MPLSRQNFFNGAAVLAVGGHSTAMEMMDAMRKQRNYGLAYGGSLIWTFVLMMPHTIALVVAYPKLLTVSNVYNILPNSNWKTASVYMMLIHNCAAFTVHTLAMFYMWEKLIGTHTKPLWIRLPSRIPLGLAVWLVALAIPFYGTINSLFSALTTPAGGYIMPCLAYNWYYRTAERRDNAVLAPPGFLKWWGWKPAFILNYATAIFFATFDSGFGIYYAVKLLVSNLKTYKFFAACYGCKTVVVKVVKSVAKSPALAPVVAKMSPALSPIINAISPALG